LVNFFAPVSAEAIKKFDKVTARTVGVLDGCN